MLVERLHHYFETYKLAPGKENAMAIVGRGGSAEAQRIVAAAMADYEEWRDPEPQQV